MYTLILLTFLNPFGAANDVVSNSSLLTTGGEYSSLQACEAASENRPEVLLNASTSELGFNQTSACLATAKDAGAWLILAKTTQNTGLRVQNDGQSITLGVADMSTCLDNLETFSNVEPVYKTDRPLILTGMCNAAQ